MKLKTITFVFKCVFLQINRQHIIKGSNIRRAGEDIATHSVVLKQGHSLRPQDLGLIASIGMAYVMRL